MTFENLPIDRSFKAGARLNTVSGITTKKESPALICSYLGAISGLVFNVQGEQIEKP